MELTHAGSGVVTRISVEQLASAIQKVRAMSEAEKLALTEKVLEEQPNLLASCLVQSRLGVPEESVNFLLHILFVCFQAMKESGGEWHQISEREQGQQLLRLSETVQLSENFTDPNLAKTAQAQYVAEHAQAPLLAFVVNQLHLWLHDPARPGAESASDKYVISTAINLVDCIATAR